MAAGPLAEDRANIVDLLWSILAPLLLCGLLELKWRVVFNVPIRRRIELTFNGG
jgi:hypothetical protein